MFWGQFRSVLLYAFHSALYYNQMFPCLSPILTEKSPNAGIYLNMTLCFYFKNFLQDQEQYNTFGKC